jgi:uncharacterized protein
MQLWRDGKERKGSQVRIVIESGLEVPMQDGTVLRGDLHRVERPEPLPTIVTRTPYGKQGAPVGSPVDGRTLIEAGFNIFVQDVRGRFTSAGQFDPYRQETDDGRDTIDWVVNQPWSTDRVGMLGGSYVGATQWLAAKSGVKALQAIAPTFTSADYYEGWSYQGGALQLGFLLYWALWGLLLGDEDHLRSHEDKEGLIDRVNSIDELYTRRPAGRIDYLDELAPYFRQWLSHPAYDDFWTSVSPRSVTGVPSLNVGGWYDIFIEGTIENYQRNASAATQGNGRSPHQLVIGPWSHSIHGGTFPEHDFGLRGGFEYLDLTRAHLDWFERTLLDKGEGQSTEPAVRYFVTGLNRWSSASTWPPAGEDVQYFLRSKRGANSSWGDGVLSAEKPGTEREDVYIYDPLHPVPTVGGSTLLPGQRTAKNAGPRRQNAAESRPDVLCYTSQRLPADLDVAGTVRARVFFASSAVDTDITIKLVDVDDADNAIVLCDNILRCRFRNSQAHAELLKPGEVYELLITVGNVAHRFQQGHRIRLDISSSNFPRFLPNSNTGSDEATIGAADMKRAINRVFHDQDHMSCLILPHVPRD